MKLYTANRSSAAWRVRIALHMKGIDFEAVEMNPVRASEAERAAYRALNPQLRVPALELDDGTVLTQSLAIIDYLDAQCPTPPLLPGEPVRRAKVRAVAEIIACDIHPLNNISVLNNLRANLHAKDEDVSQWYSHWIAKGFEAIEALLEPGPFAFGAKPGLADIFLAPQVANARTFNVPLDAYPKIIAAEAAGAALPAFAAALPEPEPAAAG